MSKQAKRAFISFILVVFLWVSARLYYHFTDDFRLSNITYPLPFEAPWKVPDLTAEEQQQLAQIFDQTFSYMGKGTQCYAFVSEDQQYVLKFVKFKHFKPNMVLNLLPPIPPFKDFQQKDNERKERQLRQALNGYDIAYRENRQYSELIYIHLLPTQHLYLQVTVKDKMGVKRTIQLDDVVFILQRKGETLRHRIHRLLKQGELQEAKEALSRILAMYVSEYEKGLVDYDHGVMHNTGFIGTQPFHLDVGLLHKEESMRQVEVYKQDLEYVIWKMVKGIRASDPQYEQDISHFLEQEYEKWTGEKLDVQAIDFKKFKKQR